jgi:hypothetical protein
VSWLRTIGRALLWLLAGLGAVLTLGALRGPRQRRLAAIGRELGDAAERTRHAGETADEAYQRRHRELIERIEAARATRLEDEQAEADRLRESEAARREALRRMDEDDWP